MQLFREGEINTTRLKRLRQKLIESKFVEKFASLDGIELLFYHIERLVLKSRWVSSSFGWSLRFLHLAIRQLWIDLKRRRITTRKSFLCLYYASKELNLWCVTHSFRCYLFIFIFDLLLGEPSFHFCAVVLFSSLANPRYADYSSNPEFRLWQNRFSVCSPNGFG